MQYKLDKIEEDLQLLIEYVVKVMHKKNYIYTVIYILFYEDAGHNKQWKLGCW